MRNGLFIVICLVLSACVQAAAVPLIEGYVEGVNDRLVDYYTDPAAPVDHDALVLPTELASQLGQSSVAEINAAIKKSTDLPTNGGEIRALLQQACTLQMAAAVRRGDLDAARAWRCQLALPRGVSASDGALLLDTLASHPDKRDEDAKLLVREAITWQTTRVRQLLDDSVRAVAQPVELPGRLRECLAEATTLATLPAELQAAADTRQAPAAALEALRVEIASTPWDKLATILPDFRGQIEAQLPSLLSDKERVRRERLLLKLALIIPNEYGPGVSDGKVTVPLEYHEAVSFTAQARQLLGELAPIWLNDSSKAGRRDSVDELEKQLQQADEQIAAVKPRSSIDATFKRAQKILQDDLGVSLARRGTTADIVDEVMLETRNLLGQSLAAATAGRWHDAEQFRLEAYTTYDPELEARLMPRDPQLAMDIERLLLDGLDQPGVKVLLDQHAKPAELQSAYARAYDGLQRATAMLKSDISPTAAVLNAGSIVLREGLEGLLVIVAILAGLRGQENAHRRRLFWAGIAASMLATAVTWILSQTLITSLRAYGELIEAIAGLVAIFVLLLITNWLFHQIYWKHWITSLKAQASEGESVWALVTAGFAVGYREGFETVLFLQSLILDAGAGTVALGVSIGVIILLLLGVAALWAGMKLPYFKLLLATAGMIGLVLITFTGTTARALQTVGWLPVHRLTGGSWPVWLGTWFGLHNTWESIACQVGAGSLVLATWRLARFQTKRKKAKRDACRLEQSSLSPIAACDPTACADDVAAEAELVQVQLRQRPTSAHLPSGAARPASI